MNETPYLVITEDGSPTLFEPAYGQSMHTMDGAYSESLIKHIVPSLILQKNSDIKVLDIGFGLGYNILALICEARYAGFNRQIEVISLERDRSIESFMRQISFSDSARAKTYAFVTKAFCDGFAVSDNVSIQVLFGDARETVAVMDNIRFDAVFHDPFSPAKNPEMWSVDFFREITGRMQDDALLTTYSSAAQIRGAMVEAGLFIGRAPSMGMKREGTIAGKKNAAFFFSSVELESLMSDKKSTPYRDPELSDSRLAIIERRRVEIIERKRGLVSD